MPNTTNASQRDWARQPLSACLWWGLPIAVGVGASFLHLSLRAGAALCAILFLWMAIGCLLNARRCRRVHCYISGPVLLLGVVFTIMVAAGILDISSKVFNNAVGATLALAMLSFVPEVIWKRYV